MTDQHKVGDTTRKDASGQAPGFDKERMVLALVGLLGAAVIVAMNVR